MTLYKIWCEWDMGFEDLYRTKEAAQKDIDEADWDMCDITLKEAIDEGYVHIEEVETNE
jgi:hypothetical protein